MITIAATRVRPLALLIACTLLLAGCADTAVVKNWTAPGVTKLQFKKVVVVALAKDDINRRLMENAVANQITQIPALVSYKLLPDILTAKDKDRVLQAVKDAQADGIILMQLKDKNLEFSQGRNDARPMDYQFYSGYYGTAYDVGAYYSEDRRSANVDHVVVIEANVYDVATEKLLWSGATQSKKDFIKIQDVGGLSEEVAAALKAAVVEKKLVP